MMYVHVLNCGSARDCHSLYGGGSTSITVGKAAIVSFFCTLSSGIILQCPCDLDATI